MAKKQKYTLDQLWDMAATLNERIRLPVNPALDGGPNALAKLQSDVLMWRRQANELYARACRERARVKRAHGWAQRTRDRQSTLYWTASRHDDELIGQTTTKRREIIKHRLRDDDDAIERLDSDRRDWEAFKEFVGEVIASVREAKELLRQQTDVAMMDRHSEKS